MIFQKHDAKEFWKRIVDMNEKFCKFLCYKILYVHFHSFLYSRFRDYNNSKYNYWHQIRILCIFFTISAIKKYRTFDVLIHINYALKNFFASCLWKIDLQHCFPHSCITLIIDNYLVNLWCQDKYQSNESKWSKISSSNNC